MERKRITCPDTGHLEEVEIERTPCGVVVASCTRFTPEQRVGCGGECARRMDRRDRAARDDRTERVLIVIANGTVTRPVADRLAATLRRDGLLVDVADVDTGTAPSPEGYNAVVVGYTPLLSHVPRLLLRYVALHRDALTAMPSFIFGAGSLTAMDLGGVAERTGWLPKGISVFGLEDDESTMHSFALDIADAIPAAA